MISALVLAALISVSAPEDRVQVVAPPQRALCDFGDQPTRPCYVMGVTIDNGVGLALHDDDSDSTVTIMGVPGRPGSFNILGVLNHDNGTIDEARYGVCLKGGSTIQCSGQWANKPGTFSVKVQLLP